MSKAEDIKGEDAKNEFDSLMKGLDCDDLMTCQHTRRKLVEMGKEAIPYLIKGLSSKRVWVRWESAKALSEIADPECVQILIELLQNPEFELRWLAAEGLARIGRPALVPLLQLLTNKSGSLWLREGIHRILHDMRLGELAPVVRPVREALEDVESAMLAPIAAREALRKLK